MTGLSDIPDRVPSPTRPGTVPPQNRDASSPSSTSALRGSVPRFGPEGQSPPRLNIREFRRRCWSEASAQALVKALEEASAETPGKAQAKALEKTPAEALDETQAETPQEASAEAQTETSVKTPDKA
jgi:hypothetical protein